MLLLSEREYFLILWVDHAWRETSASHNHKTLFDCFIFGCLRDAILLKQSHYIFFNYWIYMLVNTLQYDDYYGCTQMYLWIYNTFSFFFQWTIYLHVIIFFSLAYSFLHLLWAWARNCPLSCSYKPSYFVFGRWKKILFIIYMELSCSYFYENVVQCFCSCCCCCFCCLPLRSCNLFRSQHIKINIIIREILNRAVFLICSHACLFNILDTIPSVS